jgi:hypothetical protein
MGKKTPFYSLDAEKRGNHKTIRMKLRRISEFQGRIHFPNFDNHYDKYLEAFNSTSFGEMYRAIPWSDLVQEFNLRDYGKGPQSMFSPQGKLALMFLKNYMGLSDKKLIEQLNGNIYHQIFCDLILESGEHIENYKIVSQIRCELASNRSLRKGFDASMEALYE